MYRPTNDFENYKNLSSTDSFEYIYHDLLDYSEGLILQNDLVLKAQSQNKNFVIGLEHPTVMTLGLRAHAMSKNTGAETVTDTAPCNWNYPVYKIRRGGLATIHNPGQLVIYPIVNLKALNLSVKKFVEILFVASQKAFQDLGLQSRIDLCENPGLYTENGKIAFCGLQIVNGITMHGLSLNICNDLEIFSQISACGVLKQQLDSIKSHNVEMTPKEFYNLWCHHFKAAVFNRSLD